jgi:hypothetical protein
MGEVPVSPVCPACGETEYKRVQPKRLVAFTKDRVCRACQTRYAPPTPRWAALVFLLGGGLLLLSGLAGLALTTFALVARHSPDPVGMVLSGGVAVMGAVAGRHGIRALVYSGQV